MVVQQAERVTQKEEERRKDLLPFLDAWREEVEKARIGQEVDSWSLGRASAEAYEDFLGSLFCYYEEVVGASERGTREG